MNEEHKPPPDDNHSEREERGKDFAPCEAVMSDREFVPCEAAVSGFCLGIVALCVFNTFQPRLSRDAMRLPLDAPQSLWTNFTWPIVALMAALFALPIVLGAFAWNTADAWKSKLNRHNTVRPRVLIYLVVLHFVLIIDLLIIWGFIIWWSFLPK